MSISHKKKYLLYSKEVRTESAFELCHGNRDLWVYDHEDDDIWYRAKYVVNCDIYPWQCLGWGTMSDLREYFSKFRDFRRIVNDYTALPYGMSYKIHPINQQKTAYDVTLYLITDWQGNPCDFSREIKPYFVRKNGNHTIRSCTAQNEYNSHKEKKYNLSDSEYRELADQYGSVIHHCRPKSETFPNEWPWWHHISRSWKDQSKRRHQYRTKDM